MIGAEAIAREFLRACPREAVKLFESLSDGPKGAYIATLEPGDAALVLAELLPVDAARCVDVLDDERLAAVLAAMPRADAARLVRGLPPVRRTALYHAMGRLRAGLIELLVSYPPELVGAWVDPDVVLLRETLTVGDVRKRLRRHAAALDERLFVVDDARRLVGALDFRRLAVARRRQRIGDLIARDTHALPGGMRLETAHLDPNWSNAGCLPVTGRRGEFLGVLRRETLLRALAAEEAVPATPGSDAGKDLIEIFFAGISAEWDAWSDLVSPSREQGSDRP